MQIEISFQEKSPSEFLKITIGIDEVGRGCLAGPISACAYAFKDQKGDIPALLRDSKKLSAKQRQKLIPDLEQLGWFGHGEVSAQEIDEIGLTAANFKAMHIALMHLKKESGIEWAEMDVVVDGNLTPKWSDIPPSVVRCLIKADDTVKAVSAASVLAKVKRDNWMTQQAEIYPGYGFENHAGYGTAAHMLAAKEMGPTPLHRLSFEPFASILKSPGHSPR